MWRIEDRVSVTVPFVEQFRQLHGKLAQFT